jgi:hypothetical protein
MDQLPVLLARLCAVWPKPPRLVSVALVMPRAGAAGPTGLTCRPAGAKALAGAAATGAERPKPPMAAKMKPPDVA